MTTTRALCLSLELDFEGERVTGWLADEQGNDWAFSCWLDLLTAIERVLDGAGAGGRSEQVESSQLQTRRSGAGERSTAVEVNTLNSPRSYVFVNRKEQDK